MRSSCKNTKIKKKVVGAPWLIWILVSDIDSADSNVAEDHEWFRDRVGRLVWFWVPAAEQREANPKMGPTQVGKLCLNL